MADLIAPRAPDFGDLKVHADLHADLFRDGRQSLLSELRCVTGLIQIARAMKPEAVYRLVVPEGRLLQQGKDGLFRGVLYRQGKIEKHARFAAVRPSLMHAATVVASQVMLVSIAMQLNRIEAMVEGLSRELHRDRIATVFAGVDQFEKAVHLREPATRRHAFVNAVQTLHDGLRKTTAELRDRIAQAPDPDGSLTSHARYMLPFMGSKVDQAKKDMALAQESFQAALLGMRTLAECYAALGEGQAASQTVRDGLDLLVACDIRTAAKKARLVEFTGDQPPQAVWESYLKVEPVIRERLQGFSGQPSSAAIEFTRSELQGDADGIVS